MKNYVKIKGCWTCLYRAVDSNGQTVDSNGMSLPAKAFFRRAFKKPAQLAWRGYQASHPAAREFLATHRRGYRTNSIVECLDPFDCNRTIDRSSFGWVRCWGSNVFETRQLR